METPIVITRDKDRAEDIIAELTNLCKKHRCILEAGNGVFYLARVISEFPPEAQPIATIRQVNPRYAEACVEPEPETRKN